MKPVETYRKKHKIPTKKEEKQFVESLSPSSKQYLTVFRQSVINPNGLTFKDINFNCRIKIHNQYPLWKRIMFLLGIMKEPPFYKEYKNYKV